MTIADWTHLAIIALIALPLATYGAIEWAGIKWAIRALFERRADLPPRGRRLDAYRYTVRIASVVVATGLSSIPTIWPAWTSPGWISLGGLVAAPVAMTAHAAIKGELRAFVRRLFGGQVAEDVGDGLGLADTLDVPTVDRDAEK